MHALKMLRQLTPQSNGESLSNPVHISMVTEQSPSWWDKFTACTFNEKPTMSYFEWMIDAYFELHINTRNLAHCMIRNLMIWLCSTMYPSASSILHQLYISECRLVYQVLTSQQ